MFALTPSGRLRATYERDVRNALAGVASRALVTEADIAPLPAPVQSYLRVTGVVGRPRVHNFRVLMHGRIRNAANARWMPLAAEQHNFVDEPARFFYLTASMFRIPVHGYHRYVGSSATMKVNAAGFIPVVDVSGPEMNQGETVTMFNDMCVMAPATLVSPAIAWEPVDKATARATFTNAGQQIRAELLFNGAGELVNFWSDDRYQTSSDGKSVTRVRWSTPLGAYRSFGDARLAGGGEARWHEADGDYAYIELRFDRVEYNLRPPEPQAGDRARLQH